jgi:hypothetical protein
MLLNLYSLYCVDRSAGSWPAFDVGDNNEFVLCSCEVSNIQLCVMLCTYHTLHQVDSSTLQLSKLAVYICLKYVVMSNSRTLSVTEGCARTLSIYVIYGR